MIDMKFRVTVDGVERLVAAGPVTQVAFEREHKKSLATLGDAPMVSDLYWLAWHAFCRVSPGMTFDEFLEHVESVDPEGDDDPGPLAVAQ